MLLGRKRGGRTRRGTVGHRISWLAVALASTGLVAACSGGKSGQGQSDASSPGTSSAASSAAVQSVPLTVVKHGEAALETVPVSIDGHGPYTFVLDTGSSVSSVSKQLATALHLHLTGKNSTVSGVVKSKKVPIASIRNWKLGTVSLAPDRVTVLSDSLPGGGTVKGLLGSDELSRFAAVTLDFTHGELRLTRS